MLAPKYPLEAFSSSIRPGKHASGISAFATRPNAWISLLVFSILFLTWKLFTSSTFARSQGAAFLYDVLNETLGVSCLHEIVPNPFAPTSKQKKLYNHTVNFWSFHAESPHHKFQQIFLLSNTSTSHTDTAILSATYTNLTFTIVPLDPTLTTPRNHMDLLRHIVTNNIATALILEESADWDIRIKKQMWWFGVASRTLTMPMAADNSGLRARWTRDDEGGWMPSYADKTYPLPLKVGEERKARLSATIFNGIEPYSESEIDIRKAPLTVLPSISPYGDNWGVLWLGQEGESFVDPIGTNPFSPRGRVILPSDQTVPDRRSLRWGEGSDELKMRYPDHTRIVHHSGKAVGTTAYAVTQTSARQILFEFGLLEIEGQSSSSSDPNSISHALQTWCRTRPMRNCLGVQPALFSPFDFTKAATWDPNVIQRMDMRKQKEFERMKGRSGNIRWSVRLGVARLVEGLGVLDQWPDRLDPKKLDVVAGKKMSG